MTREIVLGLLSNKLQDVSFIPDTNILFGKYSYNQLTLGTYFIDYNESSLDFDLREYQEKYISSEYYKIPGYTQWNYYLIFIRTSYQEEQKIHIEKDDIYTRKFVFTPDELKKYFEYQKSDKAVDADIINVWKEKLKAVDLDEVYSEAPYTKAIPRYLANEVIKDIEVEQLTTKSNQKLTINKISHLKLKDDYRKYPVLKGFTLGKVNLIKGVNGSGKTSFLESIELIVAGKTIRNPSSPEKNNCIEATYNDGVLKDEYTPGDNSKYRERDIAWYASAAKSGNELFRSFNRYNFYDSDAAYNLSYNSNVGSSLSKYLSSIALGPEFSRIQNRLEGFNERLAKENNDRKKIIKEETTRSDNAKKTLESIQSASNPKEYFDSFMAFAKEIKWNKELPKKFDDSYSLFEENYQTTQSYINSLNQLLITIKLRNLKSWKEDLIKIEKALQDCNKSKVQIKEVNIIIKENDILLNNLDTQFRILESAKKFFEDQSSFNLWNLNERINLLSIEIKKSKRIIEQVERISDQSFLQNNIIFDIYKNKKTAAQQDLSNKQKQIKGQIENLKSNLNKLQGIVSEIKSHGKQYISLNENADACPLCETPYSYDELSDRISKIAQDLKENVAIDQLNNQLIKIDADLLNLEADIKNIQLLEIAISNSYSETDYAQFSLIQISDHINTIRTKVNVDEAEYLKLSQLKQDFADKGLFEENFNTIKESLEDNFENIKFVFTDKSLFEEMYNKIKKQSFDLTLLTKTAKDHLLDLENTLKKIIQEVAPSVNYLEYDAELKYRIELLKKGITYFTNLIEYINFSDQEDLSDINQKIDKLYKLHEDIKKAISDQKELQLANQIIADADKKIKQLEPDCIRLETGLNTINDILVNNNESAVLGSFIENNEKEIQEIFQNIHSPKEFSNIVFSAEYDTVLLERRIDNEKVPMNKISTGQRSALALSIFIALNKKLKNGPYIMLFDDPVTYTDDLNILSFLDYLRSLVIHEDRQLIFATANQKLAGLFEKKFAFLGDTDFKVFPFER